jgi:hypothetical protein
MDEVAAREDWFARRWPHQFEFENPFHPRAWHSEDWYLKAPVADVRAELMRRGLPQHGCKQELHDRLIADNRLILTMEGKYELHKRRLAAMEAEQKKTIADIVTFQRFPHLPPEVRLIIWECSLPGPRVLSVSDCRKGSSAMLHFREHDNESNPVALSVCRESRHVALQKYRLCFGTPNIYADLDSDILYFGSHWRAFDKFSGPWGQKLAMGAHDDMPAAVVADLNNVKYLAMRHRIWDLFLRMAEERGVRASAGVLLRRQLMYLWVSLKQLILVQGDKEDMDGLFALTPGYITFKDTPPRYCEDAEIVREGFLKRYFPAELLRARFVTKKPIRTKDFKPKESPDDLPEVRIVHQQRVTDIPDDDWDRDDAEPYVSFLGILCHNC